MDRVRPTFYASRLDFSLDFIPEILVLFLSYTRVRTTEQPEPLQTRVPGHPTGHQQCRALQIPFMDLHPETHHTHRHAVNPQNTPGSLPASEKVRSTKPENRVHVFPAAGSSPKAKPLLKMRLQKQPRDMLWGPKASTVQL